MVQPNQIPQSFVPGYTPIRRQDERLNEDVVQMMCASTPIAHFSIPALDELTAGLRAGELYGFGAMPGIGKTTLFNQLCDGFAAQGVTVVMYSLETPGYRTLEKSMARNSSRRLPLSCFANIAQEPDKVGLLNELLEEYKSTIAPNLYVIDDPTKGFEDVIALVGYLQQESNKPIVLVIDYLQLLANIKHAEILDERLAIISTINELRSWSRTLNIPVLVISSIARSAYETPTQGLSIFAGAQNIEYSFENVYVLTIDGKDKEERAINAELPRRPIVLTALKQRYGKRGSIKLTFDTEFATFEECA